MNNKKKYIILIILIIGLVSVFTYIQKNADKNYDDLFYSIKDQIIHIKTSDDLIVFDIDTLENELPAAKDDGSIDVEFNLGTNKNTIHVYGTIKVQGSSTAYWPKKNWSIKLYSDKKHENELLLKIGDSIESNKWILKADWIDPSMYRNAISYRLWDDIVDSRSDTFLEVASSSIEIDGAKGSPYIFQGLVNINDEHYGLTNILLGHDQKNFNIDKDDNHLYFEFDARGGYTSTKTWEKFLAEGIDEWIDFYNIENDEINDKQIASIDAFGEFVNSDLDNFEKNYDKYLDKRNIIDMILFYEFIHDWDAVAQDLEIVTYDLEKFYFLPWDKDTTFGLTWDESGIVDKFGEELLILDREFGNETKVLWVNTNLLYSNEIKDRYFELRNKEVFSLTNIENHIDKIDRLFTEELRQKELDRWTKRPSVDELTRNQILEWVEARIKILDEYFEYE